MFTCTSKWYQGLSKVRCLYTDKSRWGIWHRPKSTLTSDAELDTDMLYQWDIALLEKLRESSVELQFKQGDLSYIIDHLTVYSNT